MASPPLLGRMLASLSPYRLLELPLVYRIAQLAIAPGFDRPFVEKLTAVASAQPGAVPEAAVN